ncbi:hypothetical protein GA0074692_0225 [Micromonospora pallida]|uniref:Uncharacterized protein n=1 Tax=Micromonospora pallida TaxID=145854 RepID=A0A1C6RKH6_9ACTN|nr:hypothetical protein [Micromonospora pallida]SCL17672.1 hypothetical protein GA0074692_0225 [Micromonospora pallida]
MRAIEQLERSRLWDQAVSDALRDWSWLVHHPESAMWDPAERCGVQECCPDPDEARFILGLAVSVLLTGDARILRMQVTALDKVRRRTVRHPFEIGNRTGRAPA